MNIKMVSVTQEINMTIYQFQILLQNKLKLMVRFINLAFILLDKYYHPIETKNGKDRKIFFGIQITQEEKRQIEKFKKLFKKNNISFTNYYRFQNKYSRWTDNDTLRLLYIGNFLIEKTLKVAKAH